MRIQKYRFWLLAIICMALLPLSSCSDENATQAEDQKTAAQGTDTGEKPLTPIEREAGAGNGEANAVKPDERDEKQAADKASAATEKPESEKVTPATGEKMGDKNGQARMPVEKDLLHRRFELNSINGKAYDYKEKKPTQESKKGFQLSGH